MIETMHLFNCLIAIFILAIYQSVIYGSLFPPTE